MPERPGGTRSAAVFTRGWPYVLAAMVFAVVLGTLFSLAVGLSATWVVMVFGGAATLVVIAWWPSFREFAIAGYFVTLPILITKALVAGSASYGPVLEATLPDCFLVMMAVAWLMERRWEPAPVAIGPAPRLAAAILLWAWFSALYAHKPTDGFLAALSFSKQLAGFFLVSRLVRTPRDVRTVLRAASVGLVLTLGMAGLQFVVGQPLQLQGVKSATEGLSLNYDTGTSAFRPFGFLLHPNILGVYLVLLLPTLLTLVLLGRRKTGAGVWRWAAVLLLAGLGFLVLTLSRGSWIAFAVAAPFTMLVGWRLGIIPARHLRLAVGSALVMVATVGAAYPNAWRRLTYADNHSTQSRWLMLEQAKEIIESHPVMGVGLSGYRFAATQIVPTSFGTVSKAFRERIEEGYVHNAYLLQWAERGIIGLSLTLLLYAALLRRFFRERVWLEPTLEAVALGLVGGLVGQMVCDLFEHQYLDYPPGTLWPQMGLLLAIYRIQVQQRAAAAPVAAAATALPAR